MARSKMSKIPLDCASGKDGEEATSDFKADQTEPHFPISDLGNPRSEQGHRKPPDLSKDLGNPRSEQRHKKPPHLSKDIGNPQI